MPKLPPAACSPFERSARFQCAELPNLSREGSVDLGPRGPPTAATAAVLDERDVLLTRPEAAAYLRKSIATLDRWSMQGIGPRPVRVGPRSVRYRLTDLRRFVGAEGAAA
jgi:predicted DNA-binding transcriptional regulator AlpA